MKLLLLLLLMFFSTLLWSTTEQEQKQEYNLGKELYTQACAACHGARGIPNRELKLAIRPRNLNKTILYTEQLYKVIKDGAREYGAYSDIMPAFKYMYDERKIRALTLYISQEFTNETEKRVEHYLNISDKPSKSELARMIPVGKKIFLKKCSKCHGEKGEADSIYAQSSQTNQDFIYPYNLTKIILTEEQIFLFAKYGSYFWGSDRADMPAWNHKYSDIELKSVAKYIQEAIKKN